MRLLYWLLSLFSCHCREKGCVHLAYGKHQVMIKTKCAPCRIWVSLCCNNTQVCAGDMSMVGTTVVPGGFILISDIRSNHCTIHWISECCCCCPCENDSCSVAR